MIWNALDKKQRLTLVAVVGVVGVATVLVARGNRGPVRVGPPEKRVVAKVERVVSGQSIKTEDGQRVSYAGIRAPYGDEPMHGEARNRNAELVEGKKIRLRFDEQLHDRKDRLNAYVFVGREMVNETLVREGLAFVRLTTVNTRFSEQLLAAQAEARRAKRGLWASGAKSSERAYPADPKYGNFHRPDCPEVLNIKPERRVEFKKVSKALDKGFAPCSKCQPLLIKIPK